MILTDSLIDAEAVSPDQTVYKLLVLYCVLSKEMFINRVVLNEASC